MFTIDTRSNKSYYIILRDNKEFVRINKYNSLESIKSYFQIVKVK